MWHCCVSAKWAHSSTLCWPVPYQQHEWLTDCCVAAVCPSSYPFEIHDDALVLRKMLEHDNAQKLTGGRSHILRTVQLVRSCCIGQDRALCEVEAAGAAPHIQSVRAVARRVIVASA